MRQVCDVLAEKTKSVVMCPDLFRKDWCTPEKTGAVTGLGFGPWVKQFGAETVQADLGLLLSQVEGKPCGIVGFCWGR